jgi:replicative DNA helicase
VKFVDLEDDFSGMSNDGGSFNDFGGGMGSAIQPSGNFGNFGGGITMPSRMNDMPDDAPF